MNGALGRARKELRKSTYEHCHRPRRSFSRRSRPSRRRAAWILRWITTTNHKDIGTLYLLFALLMFFVGGAMAMVIRAELFEPGLQFVNPVRFNQMTTVHALIMVFGMIMPAFVGLRELVRAADDRRARHGAAAAEQLVVLAAAVRDQLLLLTLFFPGGAPAGGWTMYPPLDAANRRRVPVPDLRGALARHLVDHGRDQHHRHDHEPARARHDADQDADVRLDLADHGVLAARSRCPCSRAA